MGDVAGDVTGMLWKWVGVEGGCVLRVGVALPRDHPKCGASLETALPRNQSRHFHD